MVKIQLLLFLNLKEKIIKRIENTESKYDVHDWTRQRDMICNLLRNTEYSKNDWDNFWNEIRQRDKIRNENFEEVLGVLGFPEDELWEAEYRGRKVSLNKPMRGDVKKFKVYVKDPKTGNVKKVNFGHGGTSAKRPTMRIRKSNPAARRSFRARHNCDNPGPKTKARYWSCRKW